MNELLLELKTILIEYGTQLIATIILALLAAGFKWLKNLVIENIKDNTVRQAVRFVEQVYSAVSGSEKYNAAYETASKKLKSYGINIDADELKVKIEASVNEFFAHANEIAEGSDEAPEVSE